METIIELRDILRAKENKTSYDYNKIIILNVMITMSQQNNLTKEEKVMLTNCALLINNLYK
jgi:hypothetical protein